MNAVVSALPAARTADLASRCSGLFARRPADEDDPWDDPDWNEFEQADAVPDDLDEWDEPLPDDDDPPGLHDGESWDDDDGD
jgi:hypothetical protein